MVQVFKLWETPERTIIMAYYPLGIIVNAGVDDDEKHFTAIGQILDGLCHLYGHLHVKGVVHRNLESENFSIKIVSSFKVVIVDFGLAKIAIDIALLNPFCGSLKYVTPEVFPGLGTGYGPPVIVCSLGVIVFEWIYDILKPPQCSHTENKE